MRRLALAALFVVTAQARSQDWLGGPLSPCHDEPPPGLLLRAEAGDHVTRSAGGWRYAYLVKNRPDSRAPLQKVVFQMIPSPAFDAIDGWSVMDKRKLESFARSGIKVGPATLATYDPTGRFEVRPGQSLSIGTESEKLPGIAILRIYPRRQIPCIPDEEEARILDAKGIPHDEGTLDALADEASYTVAIPVLAPVFDPVEMREKGREVLLSAALDQLRALEPFLAMSYGARLKGFTSPVYDGRARGTKAPLEELRDQALRDVRPENRDAVLRLYAFYSSLKPGAPAPTP